MAEWSSVNPIIERFTGIRRTTLAEQKQFYEQVEEMRKRYSDSPLVQGYSEFDESEGWKGSNIGLGILANQVQIPGIIRTPTFREGMQLDKDGKLSNDILRDYGLAILSWQGPNTNLIQHKELMLPALVHYQALQLTENGKGIAFRKDFASELIVSGDEASQYLKKFAWAGDSGVRGLYRDWGGWDAGDEGLFDSSAGCRVADFVRAEGTTQNLEQEALSQIEQEGERALSDFITSNNERVAQARKLIANK